jgi:hypothetical protein
MLSTDTVFFFSDVEGCAASMPAVWRDIEDGRGEGGEIDDTNRLEDGRRQDRLPEGRRILGQPVGVKLLWCVYPFQEINTTKDSILP